MGEISHNIFFLPINFSYPVGNFTNKKSLAKHDNARIIYKKSTLFFFYYLLSFFRRSTRLFILLAHMPAPLTT